MTKFDSFFVIVFFLFSFFQHVPRVCHAESDNDEVPKDKAIKDKIKKSKSHRGHPLDGDMGYWDCEASSFEERKDRYHRVLDVMDHRHQKDMDLLDDVNNMTVLDAVIADLAVRLEAEINDMDEAVECFGKSHRTEKGYYSPMRVDLLFKWTKELMISYQNEMGELIEGIRTRILNNDHVTSELKRKMLSERMVDSVKGKAKKMTDHFLKHMRTTLDKLIRAFRRTEL